MGEAKQRKLSRDAATDEILGDHGPVQDGAPQHIMASILEACRTVYPNYNITVFVSELDESADREGHPLRFNYASTTERPDMIAVLKAFIAKNDEMTQIDEAMAVEPPSPEAQ